MTTPLDYSQDLKELAALASDPAALDAMLERALDALQGVVPYDLASVLALDGDQLRVRAARGPLADGRVRRHSVSLARFPTVRRALELRRPIALLENDHASDEGDPYDGVLDLPDGHACMVVPLFVADRSLGVITLDRQLCEPYSRVATDLAGVYGQVVALALAYAEQAALLERYRGRLREQNRLLQEEAGGGSEATRRLMASRAPAMKALLHHARLVAETDTPVLIGGETGTGKEVLASAVHAWSRRRDEAFVKLNCAAIPENLVESELFGHVRGAFSGATSSRAGRFLTANGGTLLLDEIGDLPLGVQGKLLRVLQEGCFEPVGSDRPVKVDVRVIAASHVDLARAVREGRFREDLFFRLSVFPLTLPPLRARPEDILPIAESILTHLGATTGRGPWILSSGAAALLCARDWPGNVRELVNALERATILVPEGRIDAAVFGLGEPVRALPAPVAPVAPVAPPVLLSLDAAERAHISAVLRHTRGKIYGEGGAAEILALPPSTLQSRMKRLGLERAEFEGGRSSLDQPDQRLTVSAPSPENNPGSV